MAFTNKNNKITVKGFLSSNITEVPNSSYALTFMINVCDNKNATNARANLTTGVSVKVTGELRIWHDGSYRICANDIQPIW